MLEQLDHQQPLRFDQIAENGEKHGRQTRKVVAFRPAINAQFRDAGVYWVFRIVSDFIQQIEMARQKGHGLLRVGHENTFHDVVAIGNGLDDDAADCLEGILKIKPQDKIGIQATWLLIPSAGIRICPVAAQRAMALLVVWEVD
jgi:hypothetical protein